MKILMTLKKTVLDGTFKTVDSFVLDLIDDKKNYSKLMENLIIF